MAHFSLNKTKTLYSQNIYNIYRFSSISRSTKAIFKFKTRRGSLESGQNILIDHHFDL